MTAQIPTRSKPRTEESMPKSALAVRLRSSERKVNAHAIATESVFPREFWNHHHDAALKDEAKTTCDLEEWHKDLKSAINK
jgi:hypothetical protein